MSSCSATGAPQGEHQLPAAAAGQPATADGGPDAVNAPHHLLRHVLSPEQCTDALRHFGTTDAKSAARQVNRMSQRELRDTFEKVYCVHTNSNNNTWLRRKLLEAVGASRRFYSAANKTGRPKARKAEGSAGGDRKRVRRERRPAGEAGTSAPSTPAAAAAAAAAPAPPAAHHAAAHAGPALPAGSPRALSQRLRQRGGETHYPHHLTHRMLLQQVHAVTPPFQYSQPAAAGEDECEDGSCSGRSASDVHTYHRVAAQPSSLDSGGPTSPFAAAAQRRTQHSLMAAHKQSMGSNNSLQSSSMAAPLRAVSPAARPLPSPATSPYATSPYAASPYTVFPAAQHMLQGMPPTLPGVPLGYMQPQLASPLGGIPARPPLPQDAPLSILTSRLYPPRQPEPAAVAAAGPQLGSGPQLFSVPSWGGMGGMGGLASAPSLALQPSTDLGALFGPADLPMADFEPPSKQESGTGDDWLAWDGWQLPSLAEGQL
ncbi:hypothetical protein C2E21_6998 [Chlorella sorokiniana]|uniref:Uncharacterized protein n=1 Tax=Chlorella sorokiniana TaxID=3076 RepID=A0A2P6TJ66_CHLSO|nr:hypothetical protein C2E21_6998 [Chlorella sorokiniana]|eukprot:PRW39294.1 hypothetical protein C2E21_6998 [Chlorella sorokiniana]